MTALSATFSLNSRGVLWETFRVTPWCSWRWNSFLWLPVCFRVQIGSFFMINLCLVVIATQFSETKQREHQLMQEQRARYLSSSTLASLTEPGDCYEELFQLVCHILRKACRRSVAFYYMLRGIAPPPGGGRGHRRGEVTTNGGEIRQSHSTQGEYQGS